MIEEVFSFEKVQEIISKRLKLSDEIIDNAKDNLAYLITNHLIQGRSYCNAYIASFLEAIKRTDCLAFSLRQFYEWFRRERYQYSDRKGSYEVNFDFDHKQALKIYTLLYVNRNHQRKTCYSNPSMYIKTICDKLKSSKRLYGASMRFVDEIQTQRICAGKSPIVKAAACIYIQAILLLNHGANLLSNTYIKQIICQRDIAVAAGCSEVALRNCYREILVILKMNLDEAKGSLTSKIAKANWA
jgi:transcription initiation factor TFIIIB Brf1 subunit/transcription initiation factor TFIIB